MSLRWRIEKHDGTVVRHGHGPYAIAQHDGWISATVSREVEILHLEPGEVLITLPRDWPMPQPPPHPADDEAEA